MNGMNYFYEMVIELFCHFFGAWQPEKTKKLQPTWKKVWQVIHKSFYKFFFDFGGKESHTSSEWPKGE